MSAKSIIPKTVIDVVYTDRNAIDVIFKYTVDSVSDFDSVPNDNYILNLENQTPYYKDVAGVVLESFASRAIADALLWDYDYPTNLTLKADKNSETLTGIPKAPTAAIGTDTTQIATTAFVLANAAAWGGITGTLSAQTDLQNALNAKADSLGADDNYVTDAEKVVIGNTSNTNTGDQTLSGLGGVVANAAIVAATKTKITYDTKGLVTAGADATTADVADSSNKRYVTDANLVVIGNTTNTNTGDQDLSGKEDASNKSTSVTTDQASDAKYPSVKAVYDWAVGLFATIANLALKANIASPTFTTQVTAGSASAGANSDIIATEGTVITPSFTVASNWTLTAGWESTNDSGTQLNHNAAGTTTATYLLSAPTIGTVYKVVFTMNATVTGGVSATYGGPNIANNGSGSFNPAINTPTTYTAYIRALSVANLIFTPVSASRFTITGITITPLVTNTGNLTVQNNIFLGGTIRSINGTVGIAFDPTGALRLGVSSLSTTGGFTAITTIASSDTWTNSKLNTVTTFLGGAILNAATGATSGTTVQNSPVLRLSSQAWNTTATAATKVNAMDIVVVPLTGATTSGRMVFKNTTVDGNADATELMALTTAGRLGIGETAPTAVLHLKAGTATASSSPIKLTAGTNLTTPENGAIEFDGTNLFLTVGGVRKTFTLT